MKWWDNLVARLREWHAAPLGRCKHHGCPINARSGYGGYDYDVCEIEFCPKCEDEEVLAKWVTVKYA